MSVYVYITVMALTTYLIRMLPMTLFQKEIKNQFLKSFLAYVPCACLTAMTFPAIFYSTSGMISAAVGCAVAVILAWFGRGLMTVATSACAAVFIVEAILTLL